MGGFPTAVAAGVEPDVVIGDLDSASPTIRRKLKNASWIFVDNQNNTDLEKALDFLVKSHCQRCTLAGFIGGRVDFSLGNLLAFTRYAKNAAMRGRRKMADFLNLFIRNTTHSLGHDEILN